MKVMIKGIFILTLLVFSIRVAHAAEERPQFVFTDENIASWEETEQGFSIQLTPEAQKEFFVLSISFSAGNDERILSFTSSLKANIVRPLPIGSRTTGALTKISST